MFASCDTPTSPGGLNPVTYTVNFIPNGGSPAPASQAVNEGGKVNRPTVMTKDDEVFFGWYKEENLTTLWDFGNDTISGDITLYARWITSLTSLEEVSNWLEAQTGGTEEYNPLDLAVSFDLGDMTEAGSGWKDLLAALDTAEKYVNLNLSACVMTGTEFNPDSTVATGKEYICGIVLPSAAKSIAAGRDSWQNNTFKHFSSLKTAEGSGVTDISELALSYCSSLRSVSFPAAQTIGDNAFVYCYYLESVSFPAVQSIGVSAFYSCTGLESASFPASAELTGNPFTSWEALIYSIENKSVLL